VSAARFFRARFVHFQVTAAEIFSVQTSDRTGRFRIIRHFDERKSAGPARFFVRGDMHSCDLTERLEERAKVALGRLETHVAYKEIFHTRALLEIFQTGL